MKDYKKPTRLKAEDWAKIEELYALGAATYKELSEKFGPAERTIKRHMAKAGIKKGSRINELVTSAKEKVLKEAVSEPESLAERFRKHNETTIKVTSIIQSKMVKEVAGLDEDPYGAIIRLKALQTAMQIATQTQKAQRKSFGADSGELVIQELPELIIRDLTTFELEDLKAKHEARRLECEALPLSDTSYYEESDIIDTTGD